MKNAITLFIAIAVALAMGLMIGPVLRDSWRDWTASEKQDVGGGDRTWYISQMHPWIIQPSPGTCPICGMDLKPIDPERFTSEIAIDPVVAQNIGLRVEAAGSGPIRQDLRTVGNVTVNERLVSAIDLKIAGWVERVHVDALWAKVEAGDPLVDIFSPELYSAQREYLLARRRGDEALLEAARQRLRFFDIDDDALAALEERGEATRLLTLRAPRGGVVMDKQVLAGMRVTPGMSLYRIADLGQLWVEATIYEDQLDFVEVGQRARISLVGEADASHIASVETIYPSVDPRTRAVRLRFVVDNDAGRLRPGMFATVRLERELPGPYVLVPKAAVIGTGERNLLFVSLGKGRFEAREVTLGPSGGDQRVAILDGVEAGEDVVVSGQFLLDSESRMREAIAKTIADGLVGVPEDSGAAERSLTGPVAGALTEALKRYLPVQEALADDDAERAAALAPELADALGALVDAGREADENFLHRYPLMQDVAASADELVAAQDIEVARAAFGELGITLRELVGSVGVPDALGEELSIQRCGMYRNAPDKGVWLQRGMQTRNPFYGSGSRMLGCATEKSPAPRAQESDAGMHSDASAEHQHETEQSGQAEDETEDDQQ